MSEPAYPWYSRVSADDLMQGEIIQLCPVAQAFARFFMRIGLPVDLPPFTKR